MDTCPRTFKSGGGGQKRVCAPSTYGQKKFSNCSYFGVENAIFIKFPQLAIASLTLQI